MFHIFKSVYPEPSLFWSHLFFIFSVALFASLGGQEQIPNHFLLAEFILFATAWILLQVYNSDRQPTNSEKIALARIIFLSATSIILAFVKLYLANEGSSFAENLLIATTGTMVGYVLILCLAIIVGALQEGFITLWRQSQQS